MFGVTLFSAALLHLIRHPDDMPPDVLVQKIVHIILMFFGMFMFFTSQQYRAEFSQVITAVNRKCLGILRRQDYLLHRPLRNRIYLSMVLLLLTTCVAGLCTPAFFVYDTFAHGELYFKNALPLDDTPYSWQVYVQTVLYVGTFYWIYGFCTLFIVIVVEPFLRLAMNYRIIASDIRQLREGGRTEIAEAVELQKLKAIIMECNEINR